MATIPVCSNEDDDKVSVVPPMARTCVSVSVIMIVSVCVCARVFVHVCAQL